MHVPLLLHQIALNALRRDAEAKGHRIANLHPGSVHIDNHRLRHSRLLSGFRREDGHIAADLPENAGRQVVGADRRTLFA